MISIEQIKVFGLVVVGILFVFLLGFKKKRIESIFRKLLLRRKHSHHKSHS